MNNFDVVVVGSGAGAMLAAIRAHDKGQSVLVIEKSKYYGGTSAISGGGIWIPNNHQFKKKGGKDSVDLVRTYLYAAIGNDVDYTANCAVAVLNTSTAPKNFNAIN